MRILWLTPQLPYPPRQGTTLRNFNLIQQMAGHPHAHTIALATFLAPGEALTPDSPLHDLCERIITLPQPERKLSRRLWDTLTSPQPDMALRLESPAMHQAVADLLADFRPQIVQVEGIEMGQYGLRAVFRKNRTQIERIGRIKTDQNEKIRFNPSDPSNPRSILKTSDPIRPKLIFDDHNVEYLLQKRNALVDLRRPQRWHAAAYSLIQWAKLVRYEKKLCQTADGVVAVSSVDRDELARLAPDRFPAPILVPNGIDLDAYAPQKGSPPSFDPHADVPKMVFTGKMDYRPNVDAVLWFADKALPLILAQVPTARFQIVGMSPHPRLDRLRANPAIHITGAVAEIQPYITGAAVYVAPLRVGGGTRFKILEALASGKPVVSTALGVEGLGVRPHQEALIGDTPEDFARHVIALIRSHTGDGVLAGRLGFCARQFVEERYGWARLAPALDELYKRC